MIGLIIKYQYKFEDLQLKYQSILASFPDLAEQNFQSSSTQRNKLLERTSRRLFDNMKPDVLNIDITVNQVGIWRARFKSWIMEVLKPDKPNLTHRIPS